MTLLRRARSVAAAAPAIFRSARTVLGTREAARVVVAAVLSLLAGILRARGRPAVQNAVRHFTWSAWLAAHYGPDTAVRLTDLHERHSVDPADSEADVRNNTAGRTYGVRHRDEVAGSVTPLAVWRVSRVGRRRWYAGRLWAARRGRVEASVPPSSSR